MIRDTRPKKRPIDCFGRRTSRKIRNDKVMERMIPIFEILEDITAPLIRIFLAYRKKLITKMIPKGIPRATNLKNTKLLISIGGGIKTTDNKTAQK